MGGYTRHSSGQRLASSTADGPSPCRQALPRSWSVSPSLGRSSSAQPSGPAPSRWSSVHRVGTDAGGTAEQGWSVALSGDGNTAIVGGPMDNRNAPEGSTEAGTGAAWVEAKKRLAEISAEDQGNAPARRHHRRRQACVGDGGRIASSPRTDTRGAHPDGPEIVRSAGWPTLGALIPQAFDSTAMEMVSTAPEGLKRVAPRRCFPQERRDPSFSHGRLFDIGQEWGNWPQITSCCKVEAPNAAID
jgi:hypothetical protein